MNNTPATDSFPLLSIVVPAFNSESSLDRCIDSVFSFGTSEFIEVIIVDDCSTDKTKDIYTQLSLQYLGVHVHQNTKNIGVAKSRNKGITLARGKYIGFLDSDDYYKCHKLGQKAQNILSKDAYDLVIFPTQNSARNDVLYRNLSDGDHSKGSSASLIQRINETGTAFVECHGCFIRREFLITHQIFFPNMSVGEDEVFMCNLTLKAKTFSFFDQIQYVHTATTGGLATTFDSININSYSEGIGIVRQLHTHQRDDEKRAFLELVLIRLFKCLCSYLLIFYRDKGITYDNKMNSNLKWISKKIFPHLESINSPLPTSYKVLLDNFINEIFCRIPENLSNNNGINYIYCLSAYSAATLSALTYKGIEIEAFIDDNRTGVITYKHAGVHVRSLDDIDCTEQRSTPAGIEKRFFVCHPSKKVYNRIKVRLLDRGILDKNITWVRFFE